MTDKEIKDDHWVPFAGAPKSSRQEKDGEMVWVREIHLHHKTIMFRNDAGELAFGKAWSIYPSVVAQARYGGSYEGGTWLAFPTDPESLNEPFWDGWRDSDIECMMFWGRVEKEEWPVGRGPDPSAAYADLVAQVCRMVDVEGDTAA